MTTKKTTKKTSEKQKAANRRNGKKGGPKTPQGKKVSSTNSLKHGILCKEILSSILVSEEQRNQYTEILNGLVGDLAPVGEMEEILVDKIASSYLRQRAALEMEIGEAEAASADATTALIGVKSNISGKSDETAQNQKYESWESVPMSHFLLIGQLCDAQVKCIKETGAIDGFLRSSLRAAFHAVGSDFDEEVWEPSKPLKTYLEKKGMSKNEAIEIPDGEKEKIVAHLESIRDGMTAGGFARMDRDFFETVTRLKRSVGPPLEKTGLIVRYGTFLDNSFYKASHELQRLQAFRLGKRAHVPIAVDI